MPKRLTHEQFIERLYERNENAKNIEILGEYINSQTKIKCRCKIDNHEWNSTPSSLLSGSGCPMCAGNPRKTTEQFIKELSKINPNIEILGEYINSQTKIKCKCKIDGYEWEIIPNNSLQGKSCPMCYGNAKKTHEQFVEELSKINPNIEVLGEYINNRTPIKYKCKIDGYKWETSPYSLLNGCSCPRCSKKERKTTEQFIKELSKINPNIEILGEYINSQTKIKCKCKIDGYEWKTKPSHLLRGRGCPRCNISKGEKRIIEYFENNNIEYIWQKLFNNLVGINGGSLSYDFYLPKYNLLIEYQGQYHDGTVSNQTDFEFAIQQEHDKRKKEYAKENNIQLLEIWYWDFDNIEEILDKELKIIY